MKPRKTNRRRKRPYQAPPPSPRPTWFNRITSCIGVFCLLFAAYDLALRYVVTNDAVLTYMARHQTPFPHLWLARQLERLPFPGREAGARSGSQSDVRAYSIHGTHGTPLLPSEWVVKQLLDLFLHTSPREAVAQSGNQSPEHIVYLHTDHQNRVIATTDQQGNFTHVSLPDSFGKPQGGDPGPTNLGFPGQYYDKETGLYYNNLRTYDSVIGRYRETEPLMQRSEYIVDMAKSGMGAPVYAYAFNNPLLFIDPTGLYGTKSCGFYKQACQANGGRYFCNIAQQACAAFPFGDNPAGDRTRSPGNVSNCIRQCLQEGILEQLSAPNACSEKNRIALAANVAEHASCISGCLEDPENPFNPGGPVLPDLNPILDPILPSEHSR
jgi:RHS repeat-associated protein